MQENSGLRGNGVGGRGCAKETCLRVCAVNTVMARRRIQKPDSDSQLETIGCCADTTSRALLTLPLSGSLEGPEGGGTRTDGLTVCQGHLVPHGTLRSRGRLMTHSGGPEESQASAPQIDKHSIKTRGRTHTHTHNTGLVLVLDTSYKIIDSNDTMCSYSSTRHYIF